MLKSLKIAAFTAALAFTTPAAAGPAEDATAAVTNWLDKFNAGDIAAFNAGHAPSPVIIDEFSPYLWSGAGTSQRWLDDYAKDAGSKGISGGRIDYGKPLQAVSDGSSAYIVLPTTYRFTQKDVKMAGAGSMTFVMTRTGTEWKVASWTYSGATPTAEH